jgi:UDP-3-O-acyl-N-acetylglucosamine deacetylase
MERVDSRRDRGHLSELREGDAFVRLSPADMLEIDFEIDFADAAIGRQALALNMANGTFVRELSDSRTFCRNSDVIAMRARGLALGGTLENAVVFDGDRVLSPGGLRHTNEPVRHKMLDALGDLAHSLKTPLAVIRSQLEDVELGGEARKTVQDQVAQIDDTVRYQLQRAATVGRHAFAPPLEASMRNIK